MVVVVVVWVSGEWFEFEFEMTRGRVWLALGCVVSAARWDKKWQAERLNFGAKSLALRPVGG
jgi:hypothetical protein